MANDGYRELAVPDCSRNFTDLDYFAWDAAVTQIPG